MILPDTLRLLAPEIVLTLAGCALLLLRPGRSASVMVAVAGLVAAAGVALPFATVTMPALGGAYSTGPLTCYLKMLMTIAGVLGVLFLHEDAALKHHHAEILGLALFTIAGGFLLVSARHFAVAYIAFELISVPSYALVGMAVGSSRSAEGGLKYAVFGGAASAFLLYGISMLYGLTGALTYGGVAAGLSLLAPARAAALAVAGLCVFAGAMFKLAAAPFHFWCPDAFEAAPVSVAGVLSVIPKIAGFGFVLMLSNCLDAAPAWLRLLAVAAGLSMLYGNLVAVHQMNVKRLLAYSSIAHAGYMLVAASLDSGAGDFAVLYYLTAYLFMNLGAFVLVGIVAPGGGLDEFAGLGRRAPLLAAAMAVFLFSLTGLPPFGGFIGKLFILSGAASAGAWTLIAVLVATSVVSLYYYARILRVMYFQEGEGGPTAVSPLQAFSLAVMVLATVLLGVAWAPVGELVRVAVYLV